jgi:hypothetical protein
MPKVEDLSSRLWEKLVDLYKGEHYARWVTHTRVTDYWDDDEVMIIEDNHTRYVMR